VFALRMMTLGNRADPFPKSPSTAAMFKVVNSLVYGSSVLAAVAGSEHDFNPEARGDIPIQRYGLLWTAGLLARGQKSMPTTIDSPRIKHCPLDSQFVGMVRPR
jgi:hypothetical protein